MRKFGKDKPELMKFQLEGSEKVYTMPLASSMPANVLIEMSEIGDDDTKMFKFQYELLKRYIGEAVEDLTAGDIGNIMNAWYTESSDQGAEVGESSASSAS